MSHSRQIRELRLEIGFEAEALAAALGERAYEAALQRAQEASSDAMARDWSVVAAAIGRRTGNRSASIFSRLLH
jgi:hypothetical protein